MKPNREAFIGGALSLQGVPYCWGGKTANGLDCSGLITHVLKSIGGPDLRNTHSAEILWESLEPVTEPQAGDLVFYGEHNQAHHVAVCLGGPYDPVVEAGGGNSNMRTREQAEAKHACVKVKNSPNYRTDVLGFRSTAKWWNP